MASRSALQPLLLLPGARSTAPAVSPRVRHALAGLLCTRAALFRAQLPALASACVLLEADMTVADSMAGLAAVILRTAPPRFSIVGMSMGGYLALELLAQAPARVSRLALLSTNAIADAPAASAARRAALARSAAGPAAFAGLLAELVDGWVGPRGGEAALAGLRAEVLAMASGAGTAAFAMQQAAIMGRADRHGALRAYAGPVLVLHGEGDRVTGGLGPARTMVAAASEARGAPVSFVTVPDCGHMTPLEAPDIVTAALMEWLRTPALEL